MFVYADRVKELSTTTGTGDFTLLGAVAKFFAFSAAVEVGDVVTYLIEHTTTNEFEVGIGQYSLNTLHRAPDGLGVICSSSGGLVDFTAGNKIVSLVPTALLGAINLDNIALTRLSAGPFRTYFGDGADGDLTITSGTTVLNGRRQYRRLRILGGTLNTNGYDVRAWITEVGGAITNGGGSGGNASASVPGAAGAAPGQNALGGSDSQAGKAGAAENMNGTAAGDVAAGVGGAGGAGGNGGNPGVGEAGGGGGGGGGGGWVNVAYLVKTGTGVACNASGGKGGAGGDGGTIGRFGGNGGTGGAGGRVTLLNLLSGAITDVTGPAGKAGGTASSKTGAAGGAGGTLNVSIPNT